MRSAGHGILPNSAAVVTARAEVVESHKAIAAQMRHDYMEQLMFRAEQQKALTSVVQQNTSMHKMESKASKERRAEMDAERTQRIVEEKHAEVCCAAWACGRSPPPADPIPSLRRAVCACARVRVRVCASFAARALPRQARGAQEEDRREASRHPLAVRGR